MESKQYPAALESRRQQLATRRRVAAGDPQNSQAQFDLAASFADLAEALSAAGEDAQALQNAREAFNRFTALLASDATNAIYARNRALSCERLAEVSLRGQPPDEAASWYEKAQQQFLDLQSRGALQPSDVGKPAGLTVLIARCREHRLNVSGVPQ